MIDSVILSLIYGAIAVTLGCSLFFAIEAGRANEEVVVRVTASLSSRAHRRPIVLLVECCGQLDGLAEGLRMSDLIVRSEETFARKSSKE
jgi:hypothetical protein